MMVTMKKALALLSTATLCCWSVSHALEVTESSAEVLVKQGEELHLTCAADEEFALCTWNHVESGRMCSHLTGSNPSGPRTCVDDGRHTWDDSDPTVCHLVINAANRAEDAGQYRCTLIKFDDLGEGEPQTSSATVAVEVSVPAEVEIVGDLADDPTKAIAGLPLQLQCSVSAAYPEASVTAFISDPEYAEAAEPLEEEDSEQVENEDGTFSYTANFTLLPMPEHCGKIVVCRSEQILSDGSEEVNVAERKVEVFFPPQPTEEQLGPFAFEAGADMVEIAVDFRANPTPTEEQAVWHIIPRYPEDGVTETVSPVTYRDNALHSFILRIKKGQGTLLSSSLQMSCCHMCTFLQVVLQAGAEHESGKFSSSALEVDGHKVRAVLTVNWLSSVDATDFVYSLKVQNEYGGNEYNFELEENDSYSMSAEASPVDQSVGGSGSNVDSDDRSDGQEVKEGGVGVGSIIGIVLVVVLIAALALFIFWAKSKNRCCFTSRSGGSNQPPKAKKEKAKKKGQKAGDAEAAMAAEGDPLRGQEDDKTEAERGELHRVN
jgi:hypothetical protein